MGTSSWLATLLDQEMLEAVRQPRIPIWPRTTLDGGLPQLQGPQVAAQLGGRYLLRYLLPRQVSDVSIYARDGSNAPHWVTPTPYAPDETVSWLALPVPTQSRLFVMLLDPEKITRTICGPRWVRMGKGIEYLLRDGFPKEALVFPWALQVT